MDREDYVQTDPTIYQSKQAYLVQFGRRDGVIWLESGSGRNSDLALCARYDLQEDSAGEADAYIYLFKTNADWFRVGERCDPDKIADKIRCKVLMIE